MYSLMQVPGQRVEALCHDAQAGGHVRGHEAEELAADAGLLEEKLLQRLALDLVQDHLPERQ